MCGHYAHIIPQVVDSESFQPTPIVIDFDRFLRLHFACRAVHHLSTYVRSNVDRTWWQVQTPDGPAWVADSVVLAARFAEVPVVEDAAGP